jgi:rhamnogalacturonyl hydrolase YesR
MAIAEKSLKHLMRYCEEQGYKGYDPYDGLNSRLFQSLPFLAKARFPRLAWIQLFKRLPVNLRPLVGIKKGYNPKGLALFLTGYTNLAKIEGLDKYADRINFLANKLIELKSPGYSGSCWGYNFPWEAKAFYFPRYTPTIVASTFASNALLDAYELTGNPVYLDEAVSTKDFILKDLNRTMSDNGNFVFSYSPIDKTSVFNASLLGAKLLSRIYSYTKDEQLVDTARKAVAYCCNYQQPDGSWYYSTLPWHQWIDNFHTGFNLECIIDYRRFSGDSSFDSNIEKGMDYYLKNFFDEQGRSSYYNNSLYPIDIHAPSQLFVTLHKAECFEEHKQLAERVMTWTVKNMQSPKGFFYYQKKKYLTNRIPYMRWSQAWIFYGLSFYILNNKNINLDSICKRVNSPGLIS